MLVQKYGGAVRLNMLFGVSTVQVHTRKRILSVLFRMSSSTLRIRWHFIILSLKISTTTKKQLLSTRT